MTVKMFWHDPYAQTLAGARVTSVTANAVTLDRTIFYAESGGQESDAGTIGGRPVVRAEKRGREIAYTLADGHGLNVGDAVDIAIDWLRRYRLMRLHFAAEVVLELAYRHLGPIEKIGAHIAADKARIDFRHEGNIAPAFPLLTREAERIIAEDQAIESAFSDEAAERRYWKIADFAAVPCGGTHLRRTGEIGGVALKRKNIGKGKERIEIFVPE